MRLSGLKVLSQAFLLVHMSETHTNSIFLCVKNSFRFSFLSFVQHKNPFNWTIRKILGCWIKMFPICFFFLCFTCLHVRHSCFVRRNISEQSYFMLMHVRIFMNSYEISACILNARWMNRFKSLRARGRKVVFLFIILRTAAAVKRDILLFYIMALCWVMSIEIYAKFSLWSISISENGRIIMFFFLLLSSTWFFYLIETGSLGMEVLLLQRHFWITAAHSHLSSFSLPMIQVRHVTNDKRRIVKHFTLPVQDNAICCDQKKTQT